jgi:phosphate transport system substrate-binding protein
MAKQCWIVVFFSMMIILSMGLSACGNGAEATVVPDSDVASSNVALSSPHCVQGTIQVTGSTSLQPLAAAVASDYQQKCGGSNISIGGGGSSTGLKNAENGSAAIGNSDIFANKALYPSLVDNQVAAIVFSVIINSDVTGVTNLTSNQLKEIYTGQTKNWHELGGPDLTIVPVSRPAGSGTRVTFETYVLGTKETVSGNPVANSSGEVATTVDQVDGAISYVAEDFAKKNNLHTVKIDGVADTENDAQNNTYKFWNIEHMYTKGPATGLSLAYINYVKSPAVEAIRKNQGFLDISKVTQSAIAAKTPTS